MNSCPRVDAAGLARSSSQSDIRTGVNPQFAQQYDTRPYDINYNRGTSKGKDKINPKQIARTNYIHNNTSFFNFNDDDESEIQSLYSPDNNFNNAESKENKGQEQSSFLALPEIQTFQQSDKEARPLVVEQQHIAKGKSGQAAVGLLGKEGYNNQILKNKNYDDNACQNIALATSTITSTAQRENKLPQQKPEMETTANARLVADSGTGANRLNGQQDNHHQPHRTYSLSSANALKPDDLEAGRKVRRSASRASMPLSHRDNLNQHQSAINNTTDNNNNINNDASSTIEDYPWGPNHPCFPHLNPHVPLSSPLHASTRIIRVRRDWMPHGDLAPQFANLYPEVLDPLMSEEQFRRVVEHVNGELAEAFSPFATRSWVDAAIGALTGWMWDDLGMTGAKKRLERLEAWIETWNREWGRRGRGRAQNGDGDGNKDGMVSSEEEDVWIVPLRRTGYLTVSIFIFLLQQNTSSPFHIRNNKY